MTTKPMPQGWAEMDAHLVDDHGFEPSYVDGLDADRAREVHLWAHAVGAFDRRHDHD